MKKHNLLTKYAYAWITIGFFLISFGLHWLFGWYAFVNEARDHGQSPDSSAYLIQMSRDTFENWQSEFLQLLWQVVGLAYFLYVGSPSSKENSDMMEAKIDALIRLNDRNGGEQLVKHIDERYLRHAGDAKAFGEE